MWEFAKWDFFLSRLYFGTLWTFIQTLLGDLDINGTRTSFTAHLLLWVSDFVKSKCRKTMSVFKMVVKGGLFLVFIARFWKKGRTMLCIRMSSASGSVLFKRTLPVAAFYVDIIHNTIQNVPFLIWSACNWSVTKFGKKIKWKYIHEYTW